MFAKTTVIVEGEEACKLFDCFVAYNRLVGAAELSKSLSEEDALDLGVLPTTEAQLAEVRENQS